jgi:hypothetical protein
MRRRSVLPALTVAALAIAGLSSIAPRAADAQQTSYQFGRGTLWLEGAFSESGCGLYLCLQLETGPTHLGVPGVRAGDPEGLFARAIRVALTPAAAQLGATSYEWRSTVGYGYNYCWLDGQGTAPPPREICDRDQGSGPFGATFTATANALGGTVVQRIHTPFVVTRGGYWLSMRAATDFWAYDATGRAIAYERFAPAITVTPEPATIALTGLGVLGLGGLAARRRRA